MEPGLRKKCEQLLTEMVHQRDVSRQLINAQVKNSQDFSWLYHLRFYHSAITSRSQNQSLSPRKGNDTTTTTDNSIMKQLKISMSNASFFYGFEYLGIGERLVQTPLTDRCYLTLTQVCCL